MKFTDIRQVAPVIIKHKAFAIILFIAICSVVLVIGSYVFYFKSHGISDDPSDWAQFADYIGGILNPIFAFLAFIALLWTIKGQHDALLLSKDTNRQQAEYIDRKEKKEECLSIIRHAEKQINDFLQMKVHKDLIVIGNLGQLIIDVGQQVASTGKKGDRETVEVFLKSTCDDVTIHSLYPLAALFEALYEYLEFYRNELVDKRSHMTQHYIATYIGYFSALHWMGVLTDFQLESIMHLHRES